MSDDDMSDDDPTPSVDALLIQAADLRTRLATAEALALTNGEARRRAEAYASDARTALDNESIALNAALVRATGAEAERDELRGRVAGLFESIKHGTDDHQEWLANKISAHFGLCHCGHGEHEHGGPQNDCGAERDGDFCSCVRFRRHPAAIPGEPNGANETKGTR